MSILNFSLRRSLPMILQTEAAECGLACIAMIAQFHKKPVNLRGLKTNFDSSSAGLNFQNLIDISASIGFMARPLKCEINELKLLRKPALLHWDLNHFVVLKKVTKNKIFIHDPAVGAVNMNLDEASQHFTGVALEITPQTEFNLLDESKLRLKHFFNALPGLTGVIFQVFIVSIALEIFAILSPLFLQFVTDDVLVTRDYQLLELLCIGFFLLLVMQVFAGYARSIAVQYLSARLNLQLSSNLFQHLLKLPIQFFEKRHLGDIISRFGSMKTIQSKISTDIIEGLLDAIMVLGTFAIMFIYSKLLTAIVCIALLMYVILRMISYPYFRRMNEKSLHLSAKQSSIFMESIRSILPVKIFAKELERQSQWQTSYVDTVNTGIQITKISLYYGSFSQLASGIEYIIIIYLSAISVMNNTFSIGMIIAYISYRTQFIARAKSLIDKILDYRMIYLHLDRVSDIALEKAEVDIDKTSILNTQLQGHITVKNLSFSYSSYERKLFDELSFEIHTGEVVAIIGASGMGKTTLMKLMLQLIRPSNGEILYDGKNIHKIGLKNFRMQSSAVMQNDALLSGSIIENITFFANTPDLEFAQKCAQFACIHEEIIQMPMGYQTLIGDMGNILSGGQKQRLLLARALYAKPKILFLDEASSHLDATNESYINQNIKHLGITVVMIAHRKETINMADRVIDLGKLQPT
ncbi:MULTISPECIES: peptidase domain-containing ABC transporter [Cysteiniphilum]|uniref:ABC transporter n=1 Tax=Cysteiniphilum litorale TaxID=2056700 RepID=A0A8J2Z3B6_9GAMM|nr:MULTISPECIES: peptidase domain-containing ABC transporter [Cysteiniphilum]GGF93314.1 ABC transporter [Cysteiniphilum litorale]